MKCIETIIGDIMEETEGAEHYAKLALQHKDNDRELADTYHSMSKQEAGHAENLYAQGNRIMMRLKEHDPESYHKMAWSWELVHGRMIHELTETKVMQEMYRG